LENVDAGWWKRKEAGGWFWVLVLLWVLRWARQKVGFLQYYLWKILCPRP